MVDRKNIEILSTVALNETQINRIRAVDKAVRLTVVKHREGEVPTADQWRKAEVLFTGGQQVPTVQDAQNLRWVHVAFAGVDALFNTPLVTHKQVTVTSSSGVMISQMGEYTLMALLMLGHKMHEIFQLQHKAEWGQNMTPLELRGSTVGIVGYGSVGREIARRLVPFEVKVLAAKRDASQPEDHGYTPEGLGDPNGDYFTRLYPIESLKSMLAECDFVVVALPLTAETRHIFSTDVFNAMKPGAFLVNVARGDVINDVALEQALKSGQVGGAVLDVFAQEPLSSDSVLWGLKNVIITPHVSGLSSHYMEDMVALFCENLSRYIESKPLHNVIDVEKGY
jgi:phosphoglycerate dehydrogenase-like enzyme